MDTFSVIITAGGIGKRMGKDIPKQFLSIGQYPILMHTIQKFYDFDKECEIILTLPSQWKTYWNELIETYEFTVPHQIVDGGTERFHSIQNALTHCKHSIVAIHDGVRPLVSMKTIDNTLRLAKAEGAAVPYLPLKESLRQKVDVNMKIVNRNDFFSIQTPQVFAKDKLVKAYELEYNDTITDDSSLVEAAGFELHFTEGNEENWKVTTPFDLEFVAFQLNKRRLTGQNQSL